MLTLAPTRIFVVPSWSRQSLEIRTYTKNNVIPQLARWAGYVVGRGRVPLSRHPAWGLTLDNSLLHSPFWLEARRGAETCGLLVLSHVRSFLFGRYLVSLPYLNYGGVLAEDEAAARALVDRAVDLADELDVRFLELRQEQAIPHSALMQRPNAKVNMQVRLPGTAEELWRRLSPKVRNQVRKAQKGGLQVRWGRHELLPDFYSVFSRNMRDLGTPVYGRALFGGALETFPDRSELAMVYCASEPVAGAICLHGWGVSEVPSASGLRSFRHTNANMLLYWHMLMRAIARRQTIFDFGRSSPDSNTYRFKKQWGAIPQPTQWQYYLRSGSVSDVRIDNPKYERLIHLWQHLPVSLTRWIGPSIVRGIP